MISDQYMLCIGSDWLLGRSHLAFTDITVYKRTPDGTVPARLSDISGPLVPAYTRWVAAHGGRRLLDLWEVDVLNSQHGTLQPVDYAEGVRYTSGWRVDCLVHHANGIRLVWLQSMDCQYCLNAEFGLHSDPDEIDDGWGCPCCNGTGRQDSGRELVTDIDGVVLHEGEAR